jgi:hypothetical protein
LALRACHLLGNGMGGIDWAGLPFVIELLGIQDIEMFIERLTVLKLHKPPPGEEDDE